MFIPIENIFTNAKLGAPLNWDEAVHGKCISLPLMRKGYGDTNTFTSWWKVSFYNRIKILFGCPIRLVIVSSFHPPVNVDCSREPE